MKKIKFILALLLLMQLLTACGNDSGSNNFTPYDPKGTSAFFSTTITPPVFATPTTKPPVSPTAVSRTPTLTSRNTPSVSSKTATVAVTTDVPITTTNLKWENITPSEVSIDANNPTNNFGFQTLALDPKSGAIYVGTCYQGLWKSIDQGKSWLKVNTGANGASLDSGRLWTLAIDPSNPQIIYTTAGYGVGGILKSTNGGKDWVNLLSSESAAYNIIKSADIYSIALDPNDPNHVLATFHSVQNPGQYFGNAPVIESKDGGKTWGVHPLPNLSYVHYIFFLDNSSTWLLATQEHGFWRTADAGQTWSQVSKSNLTDGGGSLYRAKTGVWYAASSSGVLQSTDGIAWKELNTPQPLYAVIGDGTNLYTQSAYAGVNPSGPASYNIALEASGTKWVAMNNQKFEDGPMSMVYDPANHLIYSSNWRSGVWKLQVNGS